MLGAGPVGLLDSFVELILGQPAGGKVLAQLLRGVVAIAIRRSQTFHGSAV